MTYCPVYTHHVHAGQFFLHRFYADMYSFFTYLNYARFAQLKYKIITHNNMEEKRK